MSVSSVKATSMVLHESCYSILSACLPCHESRQLPAYKPERGLAPMIPAYTFHAKDALALTWFCQVLFGRLVRHGRLDQEYNIRRGHAWYLKTDVTGYNALPIEVNKLGNLHVQRICSSDVVQLAQNVSVQRDQTSIMRAEFLS